MRRRDFINVVACSAIAWPLAVRAQQPERIQRIGVLVPYASDEPESTMRLTAFHHELDRRGWLDGHNVHIDYRYAAGNSDRYLPLAKELMGLQPDVILAVSSPVATTVQRETHTIPIVFTNTSDPIGEGLVANLARPGGNVTGALQYEDGIVGKWLALLKEISPHLTRAALIGNPKTTPFDYFLHGAETAAPALAVEIVPSPVESSDTDIEHVIASFAAVPNGGLILPSDSTTVSHRNLVVALAAQYRLPAVYPFRVFVDAGGLMSYGTDMIEMFQLAASYVDRILRGAKPADLPVQAPTKYQTVVNLKTAKALGFDVPASLLVRADEVIE
jgi:putative ABC transport system substrate-binding protein